MITTINLILKHFLIVIACLCICLCEYMNFMKLEGIRPLELQVVVTH